MIKKVLGGLLGLGVLIGFSLFVYLYANNKLSVWYNKGYQPVQPLPFSHKQHAGDYKIDCKYCHTSVAVSRHSSVPSLNICMNCHQVVATGSKFIQTLQDHYFNDKPVLWEKVHLLPDFVKFNHAAHVRAGKQCQTCHGPVEKMEEVYQYSDLSMGWCVNCHRRPPDSYLDECVVGEKNQIAATNRCQSDQPQQAPINCATCHY